MKVGPDDDNPNLPIQGTGRLTIDVSDPMPTLSNTTNAMGVWMHEKLRINRKLGVADFVNPAGNRVAPSAESLQSAINDFSAYTNVVDLINGSSRGISGMWLHPKLTDQPTNQIRRGREELADGDLSPVHRPLHDHARLCQGTRPCRLDLLDPDRPHGHEPGLTVRAIPRQQAFPHIDRSCSRLLHVLS